MKNKLFYVIISTVLVITTTISIMNWFSLNKNKIRQPEYSYTYDCIKEAELKYYETKFLLCDEVQKYINSIAPTSNVRGYAIVEECERFNVDIKFVLAQGEIESHFATKGLGYKLNSIFNVGMFDDFNESEISDRYKYDYPNQSIRPYLELLTRKYLVNKFDDETEAVWVDTPENLRDCAIEDRAEL
mgnify:CR=1 FL=1